MIIATRSSLDTKCTSSVKLAFCLYSVLIYAFTLIFEPSPTWDNAISVLQVQMQQQMELLAHQVGQLHPTAIFEHWFLGKNTCSSLLRFFKLQFLMVFQFQIGEKTARPLLSPVTMT